MKVRDQMPELNGATQWLNGEWTRADLLGEKPTVIHFWSVSCHLCKKDMPEVNQFRDEYSGRLNMIAVHMPRYKADLNTVVIEKEMEEQGIIQPIFIDSEHILTQAFENQYVPSYYVFDKDGVLRYFQAGSGKIETLKKRVNHILDEMMKVK
ncbi:TlpA disulfide reductase family protein [Niallia sp. NCCP-28]|uniref:TlpA family protein disulfide reductase n=1 Tax=Niallia sp. NCCP-28 TaxID=2934712 RepID=UPI00208D92C3|nr:TlpA disulfide reductase family protein [Niallia sp. NCCP-28]GKU82326.1 thiol-disulfide oxidoreductase YkuV [Niallia sp. NCCP-28]